METNIGIRPQPDPKDEGIEVTPKLIEFIKENSKCQVLETLIKNRYEYGLKKYGQSLKTGDLRNTIEDAFQELGDLLQYLYKAKLMSIKLNLQEKELFQESIMILNKILEELK
jgi:hypothetical protein